MGPNPLALEHEERNIGHHAEEPVDEIVGGRDVVHRMRLARPAVKEGERREGGDPAHGHLPDVGPVQPKTIDLASLPKKPPTGRQVKAKPKLTLRPQSKRDMMIQRDGALKPTRLEAAQAESAMARYAAAMAQDLPDGFEETDSPSYWKYVDRPLGRVAVGILLITFGVLCVLLAQFTTVADAEVAEPKTPQPAESERFCNTTTDCVTQKDCYQHWCIHHAALAAHTQNNLGQEDCDALRDCLTAKLADCACQDGLCASTLVCQSSEAGHWILLAMGLCLIIPGLMFSLLSGITLIEFYDHELRMHYRTYKSYRLICPPFANQIPYTEIGEVRMKSKVKMDPITYRQVQGRSSQQVYMILSDGDNITLFVGMEVIADQTAKAWRNFLHDRKALAPPPVFRVGGGPMEDAMQDDDPAADDRLLGDEVGEEGIMEEGGEGDGFLAQDGEQGDLKEEEGDLDRPPGAVDDVVNGDESGLVDGGAGPPPHRME